jgi:lysozyme family protein
MRYGEIWPRYAGYWNKMVINPSAASTFNAEAKFAFANKVIYQRISDGTQSKVPWEMLACLHRRESDSNFATYLGNGQSLAMKTTEVPAEQGPFCAESVLATYTHLHWNNPFLNPAPYADMLDAFVKGGISAVAHEGWDDISDWRVEKMLYYMLMFNGAGSEAWGHPSSYVWGLTNIQLPGKWIKDHVWSNTVTDPQPGCAPLLKTIASLDSTITFIRES